MEKLGGGLSAGLHRYHYNLQYRLQDCSSSAALSSADTLHQGNAIS